jgi:hypothetical protein
MARRIHVAVGAGVIALPERDPLHNNTLRIELLEGIAMQSLAEFRVPIGRCNVNGTQHAIGEYSGKAALDAREVEGPNRGWVGAVSMAGGLHHRYRRAG